MVALTILDRLKKLNTDGVREYAVEMLHHQNSGLRATAVQVLARLRDTGSADVVAELLHDTNRKVVLEAAITLMLLRDARALEPLIDIARLKPIETGGNPNKEFHEHKRASMRERAVRALGRLGDSRAVGPLIDMLDGCDPKLSSEAACSLARLGDDRGVEYLLDIIESGDMETMMSGGYDRLYHAINALCQLKYPRSVEPLVGLYGRVADPLTWHIMGTLASMGTQEAVDALKVIMASYSIDSIDAARYLAQMGYKPGFEFLRAEVDSGDEKRRRWVVVRLWVSSQAGVLDLIESLIGDPSVENRVRLVDILKRICLKKPGNPRAVELLERMRHDPHRTVWVAAWKALNALGEEQV